MIEIKNLTKVYKSKKKNVCTALDNLSFCLPDKGMVFIIGKSGSGKSTLLNLLGGLDTPSSGEIIADGINLSDFSRSDYNKYRSSYIGFIFQDYHLLDDLTIAQNIELALDLANKQDKDVISKMLKMVDLEGYEDRYPSELSGGQQQRVAIARALAKDPKMILGDEPTGNLDSITSKQVLDFLKEVSKEKLVVIVSHNLGDADKYADRIIELYDGKILKDKERKELYNNDFKLDYGVLCLPHHYDLSNEDVNFILENKKKIKMVYQIDDGFKPTKEIPLDPSIFEERKLVVDKGTLYIPKDHKLSKEQTNYILKHQDIIKRIKEVTYEEIAAKRIEKKLRCESMSIKNAFKLFGIFLNRRIVGKIVTSFLAAVIISVFYVTQAISQFDSNNSLANEMVNSNELALIVRKGYLPNNAVRVNSSYANVVTQSEYDAFYNDYKGNVYMLYNSTIPIDNATIDLETMPTTASNTSSFYIEETYGTLNCEEEFLIKKYGVNGKLNVLAGDLYSKSYGTIITDYIADSILFYRSSDYTSYEDIIGEYTYSDRTMIYISAIIDTNYETKYKKVKEIYDRVINDNDANFSASAELDNEDSYIDFLDEVNKYLGIGYNFSSNYLKDIRNDEFRVGYNLINFIFSTDQKSANITSPLVVAPESEADISVGRGQIIISYIQYNKMFGTKYNENTYKDFVPHNITLTKYADRNNKEIIYQETFIITGLHKEEEKLMLVDDNDYKKMNIMDIIPYTLYFDNPATTTNVLGNVNKFHYVVVSNDTVTIHEVNRAVEIFGGLLDIISVVLVFAAVIYLVSVGVKNIRNNIFEIGVLRAMGARTRDISIIFILQSVMVGIVIVLFTLLGMHIASFVANEILVASFESMFGSKFHRLKVVAFYPPLAFADLFIVWFIVLISSIIPTIWIRNFRPVDILKAKE